MKIVFLLFLLLSINTFSQEKDDFINGIQKIEKKFFLLLGDRNYFVFSTTKILYLYIDYKEKILEIKIELDDNYRGKLNKIQLYKKADLNLFDIDNYYKGDINFSSNFYKENKIITSTGLPLYFSYNIGYSFKYCQYFLTAFVKPVPMKEEVYSFMMHKLMGIY